MMLRAALLALGVLLVTGGLLTRPYHPIKTIDLPPVAAGGLRQ